MKHRETRIHNTTLELVRGSRGIIGETLAVCQAMAELV